MSFAYHAYEAVHMMVSPARAMSDAMHLAFKNPANPLTYTPFGRSVAASCELFERTTRRYGKPAFGLDETTINGVKVAVEERVVWERPFCKLVYFDRKIPSSRRARLDRACRPRGRTRRVLCRDSGQPASPGRRSLLRAQPGPSDHAAVPSVPGL